VSEQTTTFKQGDPIVHPSHGAGRIISIPRRRVGGVERQYYCIELVNDHGTLMIPVERAEASGLRKATLDAAGILDILSAEPNELDDDHRKRQAEIELRIRSGDAELVTQALRDLAWREHNDSLTERDQKLKSEAEALVIGELALQPDLDLESAATQLHQHLAEAIDAQPDLNGQE